MMALTQTQKLRFGGRMDTLNIKLLEDIDKELQDQNLTGHEPDALKIVQDWFGSTVTDSYIEWRDEPQPA